jgi:hypothetical protein
VAGEWGREGSKGWVMCTGTGCGCEDGGVEWGISVSVIGGGESGFGFDLKTMGTWIL